MTAVLAQPKLDPFLGDSSVLRLDRLGMVKSALFRHRKRYILEQWDQSALDMVYEQVGSECLAALRDPPILSKWMEHGPMLEVDRIIAEQLMDGDMSQMHAFGFSNAKVDFEQLYAHLVTMFTGPEFLLKRISSLFSMHFRNKWTDMSSLHTSERHVLMQLRGNAMHRYMCRFGITGWLEAVLGLYKVEIDVLEHNMCLHDGHDHCEWIVRWL